MQGRGTGGVPLTPLDIAAQIGSTASGHATRAALRAGGLDDRMLCDDARIVDRHVKSHTSSPPSRSTASSSGHRTASGRRGRPRRRRDPSPEADPDRLGRMDGCAAVVHGDALTRAVTPALWRPRAARSSGHPRPLTRRTRWAWRGPAQIPLVVRVGSKWTKATTGVEPVCTALQSSVFSCFSGSA